MADRIHTRSRTLPTLAVVMVSFLASPLLAMAQWTTAPPIPTARSQASVASDPNGLVHVIGGLQAPKDDTATHQVYDPDTDEWTTATSLPLRRGGAGTALGPDGRIYVFGGFTRKDVPAGYQNSLFIYNPAMDSWTAGASMLQAAWETEGDFGLDGRLYVFGGEPARTALQIYDPNTDSWVLGADLPLPRQQHGAFRGSDGRFYIVGGREIPGSFPGDPVDTTLIYNPTLDDPNLIDPNNPWSTGPNMPAAVHSFGHAFTPDRVLLYVIGGSDIYNDDAPPFFDTVFVFDVSTQTWATFSSPLPTARRELGATLSGGVLRALGGSGVTIPGTVLATHEALDLRVCGNGTIEADEQCDDGNTLDGDGCSSICQVEQQPQNPEQQKCILELNKNLAKVAKTQGTEISKCIKDGSKDKLEGQSIEQCATADNGGKVGKATQKTIDKAADKCASDPNDPGFPDFGVTDPNTVNQVAIGTELALIHEIFGSDLDAAIFSADGDTKDSSKCQQLVADSVKKCQDAKLKEFNGCKKDGLKNESIQSFLDLQGCMGRDPKGKIAKACEPVSGTIRSKIDKKCVGKGVDLLDAFASCDTDDPGELAICLDQIVECQVCLALNEADALDRDCDDFDDGVVNESCP